MGRTIAGQFGGIERLRGDWAVVVTRYDMEFIAERGLRERGYRAYCPTVRRIVWPGGRRNGAEPRQVPLLPGYVFAHELRVLPDGRTEPGIGGVLSLLASGHGLPVMLQRRDIDAMRDAEIEFDDPWPRRRGRPRNDLKIGDAVSVEIAGEALLARLTRLSPNGRAVIERMLFDRMTAFEVDAGHLVRA